MLIAPFFDPECYGLTQVLSWSAKVIQSCQLEPKKGSKNDSRAMGGTKKRRSSISFFKSLGSSIFGKREEPWQLFKVYSARLKPILEEPQYNISMPSAFSLAAVLKCSSSATEAFCSFKCFASQFIEDV